MADHARAWGDARGHGGLVARAGAGRVRGGALPRRGADQSHAGPSRLPRVDGGLRRGEGAPLHRPRRRGRPSLNVDDAFGRELSARVEAPHGARQRTRRRPDADIVPRVGARRRARDLRACPDSGAGRSSSRSRLVGAHNLENLLLALGHRACPRARPRARRGSALEGARRTREARALRCRGGRRDGRWSTTRTRRTRSRGCSTRRAPSDGASLVRVRLRRRP